jgi:hypothetical protein
MGKQEPVEATVHLLCSFVPFKDAWIDGADLGVPALIPPRLCSYVRASISGNLLAESGRFAWNTYSTLSHFGQNGAAV